MSGSFDETRGNGLSSPRRVLRLLVGSNRSERFAMASRAFATGYHGDAAREGLLECCSEAHRGWFGIMGSEERR